MQENTEICVGEYTPPEKFEKCKSSRPENQHGSISIGHGKFARGVKCAPAPPANPPPQRPRPDAPRPGPGSPDRTPPDAPGRPQARPGAARAAGPAPAPPALRRAPHRLPPCPDRPQAPEIIPEDRKEAQRPTVARISSAAPDRKKRPADPGGPRRPGGPARTNYHAQPHKLRPGQQSGPGRRKPAPATYLLYIEIGPGPGPVAQLAKTPPDRISGPGSACHAAQGPRRTPCRRSAPAPAPAAPDALPRSDRTPDRIRAAHQPGQTDGQHQPRPGGQEDRRTSTSGPRWTAPPGPAHRRPVHRRRRSSPAPRRRPCRPSPCRDRPGPARATKRTKNSP